MGATFTEAHLRLKSLLRLSIAAFGAVTFTGSALSQSLIRDTEIEMMMREYANPIIEAAELDPNSVDLYLIGDMNFNAFVMGGQNIFFHTGAIITADQPNEIKGVLAHEIGHIAGAHLLRSGEASKSAMATMLATMGLGLAAALAGEGGAGAALIASSQQFAALDYMTYSRAQESAADQAAVGYLDKTGQTSIGLVNTFERFRYQEVMSNARRMQYFRSHPLSSQRIQALRNRVDNSPYAQHADSPEEVAQLRRIQGKIIGFMASPAQTFLRYPESDTSLPARYARAVAYYKDGQLARAREHIEALIADEPDNPFFYELEGQMLFESGHIEESIAPYERSVELLPNAPLIRINLAGSLVALGGEANLQLAREHLNYALVAEPDNSFGWYQMSMVYQGLGDNAMAELATAERAYSVGDKRQAYTFATRAREDLERGTPSWIRASELIAVSTPTPEEMREIRRRERSNRR
ncbi:M48 family metalloprotease [Woodsholea maritima]|uniref:M48 family metalloprotease n=1 Tax=Woodsholea maritima TaxID=240237 RepID=UPI00039F33A8|nr:M48 family metalloprotease [Woodsholea maritima]